MKLDALSTATCTCGQELKWSMAGWVHKKSGHGVCFTLADPQRAEPREEK